MRLGFRILALRERPCTSVAASPKRAAHVDEHDFQPVLGRVEQQQSRAQPRHCRTFVASCPVHHAARLSRLAIVVTGNTTETDRARRGERLPGH